MKKNLFKVFLLSAATAGMVFSSCTSYDDDIDDLNQRIEELSGEIALKADKGAVQALEQKLSGIDFSKYATTESVEAAIKALGDQTKADLEAAIKGIKQLSEDDVKGIFTEQMKAYDIWGSVNTKVADAIQEALKGTLKQSDINTIIAAAVTEINKDGSDISKAILGIVGKDMEKVLAGYVTNDALNGYITSAEAKYTAMEKDVEAKLAAANEKLVAEISKQIADNNTIQKTDLDEAFAEYDAQIASLWTAVGNLANRIQSLVYVPASADGIATFSSYNIAGVSLIASDGNKSAMTFRVSPASLAAAIANGYNAGTVKLAFLPELVTRAAAPDFTIDEGSVTATKDGKISMVVSTDYRWPNEDKTYAIALQVIDSKKAEGETIETGVEFTSEYVATNGGDDNDVYDNIVLGTTDENGSLVEVTTINDALQYVKVNVPHTFFASDKYFFVYKDGSEVISIDDAAAKYNWDYKPETAPVFVRNSFEKGGVVSLSVVPENPMTAANKAKLVTVSLQKAEKENIGKIIEDDVNLFVTLNGETVTAAAKNYVAELEITKENLGTIECDRTVIVTWNVDNYNNGGIYTPDYVKVDVSNSVLTSELFKDIDWTGATWTFDKNSEIVKANENLGFSISGDSQPYTGEPDSKVVLYTISGYFKGSGSLDVSAEVPVGDYAVVTVKGVIEFNGLSDLTFSIDMPEAEYSVSTYIYVDVAEKFAASLYELNADALKVHFGTSDNFVNFMSESRNNFASKWQKITADGKENYFANLQYQGDALRVRFVRRFVDFDAKDTYTFNIQSDTKMYVRRAGFNVEFKGSVTIMKGDYYLMKGVNLYDAEVPYVVAPGTRTGFTYKIENVRLDAAYKANKEGAVVTYVLDEKPADYADPYTYPTISGDVLNWNNCSLGEVGVTATLTVQGVTMDVRKFNVKVLNPIADVPTQDLNENVVYVKTNEKASVSLLKGVSLTDRFTYKDAEGNMQPYLVIDPVAAALDADSQTAYDTAIEYGEAVYKVKKNGAFVVDNAMDYSRLSIVDGVLTVSANDAELANEIEVTVPVKLTYRYSIEHDATNKVWVRKPIEFEVVFIVKNAE